MSYADFLTTKKLRAEDAGFVSPDPVHPMLFDWQAEIVRWALRKGRAALFEDCGLGKTFQQIEWARHAADRSLILAPLSVARQTIREAAKLDIEARYVRDQSEVDGPGVWVTNYEMAEHFDPSTFGAVVLDESSILKNVAGRTRQHLTSVWADIPMRLACTATPAPNDVTELCNHAEFLGRMGRAEMLAFYFVNDEFHGKTRWRLKGHAQDRFYEWMATWAVGVRRPSDLGFSDAGFDLPPLRIHGEIVAAEVEAAPGQLFASLGGVTGRAKVRRGTTAARVGRAAELATDGQWIVWCGMNDEADQVTEMVDGAVNVEGSWAPDRKAEALEAFQDGAIRVLVTKTSIAGFGMNFQGCHRMAFVGLSDSYESYYQAIRRCWRFGQTEPVDVHIVVSELEQEIVRNVQMKEDDSSAFTDGLIRHTEIRAMEAA
jgi:hypothetical protein